MTDSAIQATECPAWRNVLAGLLSLVLVLGFVASTVMLWVSQSQAQTMETRMAVSEDRIERITRTLDAMQAQVVWTQNQIYVGFGAMMVLQFVFRLNPNWLAQRERRR